MKSCMYAHSFSHLQTSQSPLTLACNSNFPTGVSGCWHGDVLKHLFVWISIIITAIKYNLKAIGECFIICFLFPIYYSTQWNSVLFYLILYIQSQHETWMAVHWLLANMQSEAAYFDSSCLNIAAWLLKSVCFWCKMELSLQPWWKEKDRAVGLIKSEHTRCKRNQRKHSKIQTIIHNKYQTACLTLRYQTSSEYSCLTASGRCQWDSCTHCLNESQSPAPFTVHNEPW